MKVIAINGSPRVTGNTQVLLEQVLTGAAEKGAETKQFNINQMNIKGCQACMHCRINDGCAQKDDMQLLYDEIKAADAVVIGTPIYMFQETAQTKTFVDRLFPFLNMDFSSKISKKGLMVVTQGNPEINSFRKNIESLNSALGMLGIKIEDTIYAGNGNVKGAIAANKSLMSSAKQAGAKLAD
ncbi:MAG: flavodoxin family protein [Desulfitobacteriaceae bacterium]